MPRAACDHGRQRAPLVATASAPRSSRPRAQSLRSRKRGRLVGRRCLRLGARFAPLHAGTACESVTSPRLRAAKGVSSASIGSAKRASSTRAGRWRRRARPPALLGNVNVGQATGSHAIAESRFDRSQSILQGKKKSRSALCRRLLQIGVQRFRYSSAALFTHIRPLKSTLASLRGRQMAG